MSFIEKFKEKLGEVCDEMLEKATSLNKEKVKMIRVILNDLDYWLSMIETNKGYTSRYILEDIQSKWVKKLKDLEKENCSHESHFISSMSRCEKCGDDKE